MAMMPTYHPSPWEQTYSEDAKAAFKAWQATPRWRVLLRAKRFDEYRQKYAAWQDVAEMESRFRRVREAQSQ